MGTVPSQTDPVIWSSRGPPERAKEIVTFHVEVPLPAGSDVGVVCVTDKATAEERGQGLGRGTPHGSLASPRDAAIFFG